MLYGIEINEPYQANAEFKLKCLVRFAHECDMGWTPSDSPTAFASSDEDFAGAVAKLLAPSFDPQVVPLEHDVVEPLEDAKEQQSLLRALTAHRRFATQQSREIR